MYNQPATMTTESSLSTFSLNFTEDVTETFNYTLNDSWATTVSIRDNSNNDPGLKQYVLYDVTVSINRYYLWVILALGFPGNFLSLLTILRMPTVSSSKMHVAMLAVVDNCAIASKLLYHQLSKHKISLGQAGCKVILFMGNFFSVLASWILVAMTLERFIAVWFPLKVSRIYSKRRASLVLVSICFLTFAFNSIFLAAVTEHAERAMCTFHEHLYEFMLDYWYWADALAYAILPCLLVLGSNSLIILSMHITNRTQRRLTNNLDPRSRRLRDQQQVTTMMIIISIVFLVLMLPNSIFYLVSESWKKTTTPTSYSRMEFFFTKQLVHAFSDLNHAVNFYLYFLSMATFRRSFLDTLLCRKPSRRPAGVSNSSVFKTSHSYVSFQSAATPQSVAIGNSGAAKIARGDMSHNHSLTNMSDVSSEV